MVPYTAEKKPLLLSTNSYRKIAGDSCFAANETFFLPKVRPCPVVAPGALFIDPSIKIGGVGQAVSFTLQQVIVSTVL